MKVYHMPLVLLVMLLLAPLPVQGAEPETGYIFLGDSRTVGMDNAVGLSDMDDTFVVAECGMGCDWMVKTGFPEIEEIMEGHPEYEDWILVTNLGINDVCSGAGQYLDAYEQLPDDVAVYLVSVNPCKDRYAYLNGDVERFNKELEESEFYYIDTWSVLNDKGFDTRDGLHYDRRTYELISYIITENLPDNRSYGE